MTNDDNWVICGGGSPHMRVTLLVVYKSCSLSPFASTIGFDLIGSNFYTPHLPPSLIPPLLSLSKQSNSKMKMTKLWYFLED